MQFRSGERAFIDLQIQRSQEPVLWVHRLGLVKLGELNSETTYVLKSSK